MRTLCFSLMALLFSQNLFAQDVIDQINEAYDQAVENRTKALAEHAEFDSETGAAYAKLDEAANLIIEFVIEYNISAGDASIMFDDLIDEINGYYDLLDDNVTAHDQPYPKGNADHGYGMQDGHDAFQAQFETFDEWEMLIEVSGARDIFAHHIDQDTYIDMSKQIGVLADSVLNAVQTEIATWFESIYGGGTYYP